MNVCQFREESGQAMPLMALLSLVVFAMMGLAADGSWAYVQVQAAQNAADAGARAAAREIVYQQYSIADSTGIAVAEANLGIPKTGHTVSLWHSATPAADVNDESLWSLGPPSAATRSTRARVSISTNTLFIGVIGIEAHSTTAASAVTIYNTAPFASWDTLFPLAIPVPAIGSYTPGTTYYLWGPQAADFASYYSMPSQWKGLINLNNGPNTNTTTLSSWASTGYPGTLNIGDKLAILDGSAGSNIGSGLQAFILAHPFIDGGGTHTYIRIATFNAYDSATQKVTINGFQVFKVYYNAVAASSASGIFVGYLNLGGTPITSSYSAFGPFTLKTTS